MPNEEVAVDDTAAEAALAAEFEAGFTGGAEEPVAPVADDKPAEESTPAAEAAPPVVEYQQITKQEYEELKALSTQIEQIRADAGKRLDTAFGKVGGLERTIKELQGATPAGYTIEVTDDIVADLKEEFPEIGDMALKAFKAFAGKLKGTAPAAVDSKALEEQTQAAVTGRVRALQAEALEEDYPGWRVIVGAPTDAENAYRKWLKEQPAEYQQKVGSTESATVVGKSLEKFKAAEKAAAEAHAKATAEAEKAKNQPSARQQRLAAAVVTKGAGGNPPGPSDADEFMAGFKSG
jgi:hypothetical protein